MKTVKEIISYYSKAAGEDALEMTIFEQAMEKFRKTGLVPKHVFKTPELTRWNLLKTRNETNYPNYDPGKIGPRLVEPGQNPRLRLN